MKPTASLLLLLALGTLLPPLCNAQTATPPPPPKLSEAGSLPTVPSDIRYLNNPTMLARVSTELATFNDHSPNVIFIGDSITEGWRSRGEAIWQSTFVPRGAFDFGIGGDRTENILWRLDNFPLAKIHPKVAVVLIGTNNTQNTAPQIAAGVRAVLTKTQAVFPGVKIILVSIMPNTRNNTLMMATDALIQKFADARTIFYLDLVPLMTPVGDNFKGLGPDHLHLTPEGYQLWADALLPLLDKLLPRP